MRKDIKKDIKKDTILNRYVEKNESFFSPLEKIDFLPFLDYTDF